MSVATKPGSISTTLIPIGANSIRRESDSASTAYFVAPYTPMAGKLVRPTTELMLMMRPARRARMAGRTARVTASNPKTLVSNCRFTSWVERVSTGPVSA